MRSSIWRVALICLAVVVAGCVAACATLLGLYWAHGYLSAALVPVAWGTLGLAIAGAAAVALGWVWQRRM